MNVFEQDFVLEPVLVLLQFLDYPPKKKQKEIATSVSAEVTYWLKRKANIA